MKIKIIRGVYDFNGSSWVRRPTFEECHSDPEVRVTVRDPLTVSEIKHEEQKYAEVREWDKAALSPELYHTRSNLRPISLNLPKTLISILKILAKKEGISYKTLIRMWIDEQVEKERILLRESKK